MTHLNLMINLFRSNKIPLDTRIKNLIKCIFTYQFLKNRKIRR